MIGRLTETSLTAAQLGMTYEQMAWPQDPSSYDDLRDSLLELLAELDLGVEVPATQDEFTESRGQLSRAITSTLSQERSRLLGDTVALPVFFLMSFALRAAVNASLGMAENQERDFVQDCLEDLGVERDLVDVLDREVGWVMFYRSDDDGEPYVRHVDLIKAGGSFFTRVLEEFARKEAGLSDVLDELKALTALVGDFRDEQRHANERIEQLVREGDEELLSTLRQIQDALVAGGMGEADAERVVEEQAGNLWDRVVRWLGGSGPKDAAEAALWAALDFVPAGTGVKLGIKIGEAVRKSMRGSN
jgi:hypothetical protein